MYKKIYKNMRLLSVLSLLLAAVATLAACYSAFSLKLKENMASEASLFSHLISSAPDIAKETERIDKEYTDKFFMLLSPSGDIMYESDPPPGAYSSTVSLPDGSRLTLFTPRRQYYMIMLGILGGVLILAGLIFLFMTVVSKKLTDEIIAPIERIYDLDSADINGIYDEIKPFVRRIQNQNKEITRQANKALSRKYRLQAVTENMNEGLIIIDKDTYILSVNSAASEFFNISEYTFRQKKLSDTSADPILFSAVRSALSGEKADAVFQSGEKTYQAFISPVFDEDKANGAVILIIEITEKSESEAMRREFTANVSHELKTPLTSIHGYAQVITSGIARPEDILGFAKKIEKESSRLIFLIDDIMKLSRLDENTTAHDLQNISLMRVINDVGEMLRSKTEEKGISVSMTGSDTLIYANLSEITELVYNLFDNAVKYNVQNGQINISVSDRAFSVADTGIGIPKEYIGRIFERFFRVDKSHSKKVNGTGLGLSIVKHIAIANNATIDVDSVLGKGTVFTVRFSDDRSKEE